jgi:hypothetical protein
MSNPFGPPAYAVNSRQAHRRTQQPRHAGPRSPSQSAHHTESPVPSIQVGPNTTETDILNTIAMHIFGPEMRREAEQASTSRALSDSQEEISQLESAILWATGISMNDIIDPGLLDDLSKRMR